MKIKMLIVSFIFMVLTSYVHAAGFMAVANVTKIKGSALINKEKIAPGAEIAEGMNLVIPKIGDFVDVKFQNGHVIRFVGANIKVETLNPKTTVFNILKGKVYFAIKPMTENETFSVKTKRATFQASGASFMVIESKKQFSIYVSEGSVALKAARGEININKDEDLVLINRKGKLKVSAAAKSIIDTVNSVLKDMSVI